jgi:tetratricopeptide (TPR) repeat protein
LEPVLTENLADLLFEVGRDCSSKALHEGAAQWLERAYDILVSRNSEELSSDAGDLQTAIMHTLARVLMKIPGDEARSRAWNIANDLDSGLSDKLAVLLLKLDLFENEPGTDLQDYCNILLRIIRMIHVTEATFKTVLHYIHKLRSQNPTSTHIALDEFLQKRLIGAEKPEWLEKVLVTIVWNITTSTSIAAGTSLLKQILDSLSDRSSHSIGASATHAAQILLWKRIEASYNQDAYADAISWCHLALHKSFDKSGELNLGKIQRKLLLCSLATSDFPMARSVYSEMSASAQTAQETQYLMYKIGLRSGDADLASECLEKIYQQSAKDATLLYACVLEAQHTGQRSQAVSAMQLVLEKYNYGSPPGVNLPALLRCTARLLIAGLEDPGSAVDSAVDAVCKLFDGAAAQAKMGRRDPANHRFDLPELDWFSRNTYNLALKVCGEWNPPQTIRLVQSCLKFIDLYPTDMDTGTLADLSLRRMFCDFLAGSLLVMMAREEDAIEAQLQYYLAVRKHAKAFQAHFQSQIGLLRGGAKEDLSHKASALLSFDFEAAVRLKAWEDVSQIVKDSKECGDPKLYGTLADVILSSEASTETMIVILQQIVNLSWHVDGIDMIQLARWVRCLYQLALTSKVDIAEFLLEQVCGLAKDDNMV